MNEEKKVPFKWEYGEETISLQLGMYANNQRLYIGMITHTEDGAEAFADMTVNLPGYSLDPGEAFISGDISKDLLRFIKENKLGKVLPYQVQSGYGKYSAVAFDLEKLKAFDPKGVAEFREEWNLPDKKPVKKKNRGVALGIAITGNFLIIISKFCLRASSSFNPIRANGGSCLLYTSELAISESER